MKKIFKVLALQLQHLENLYSMNYHRHTELITYYPGKHLAFHFPHQVPAYVQTKAISFDTMTVASPVKGIKKVRQFFLFQTTPRIFNADKFAIFLFITKIRIQSPSPYLMAFSIIF